MRVTNPIEVLITTAKVKRYAQGPADVGNPYPYTAKNVGALEVFIDVQKYIDYFKAKEACLNGLLLKNPSSRCSMKPAPVSVIQVRIGLPTALRDKVKRSSDDKKFVKVFSAKMSVPVDLMYRVDTAADIMTSTPTTTHSQAMYFIVDNEKERNEVKLVKKKKKVQGIKRCPTSVLKEAIDKDVETTTVAPQIIGKVTLSKDFIAAVNKHILELYEKFSALSSTTSRSVKKRNVKWRTERRCVLCGKAKGGHAPAEAMCNECAACDAVITDLKYQFDYLADYMDTHCKEIQYYFWMNPSGGKKFRETMRSLDKTLEAYYKRTKGKCPSSENFRCCEPLVKRSSTHRTLEEALLDHLQSLTDDVQNIVELNVPYTRIVKRKANHFFRIAESCLDVGREKKSNITPQKKNLQILHNRVSRHLESLTDRTIANEHIYKHRTEIQLVVKNNKKRTHHLVNSLSKKNVTKERNLSTESSKALKKREAHTTQAESPLILLSGATFWQDYNEKAVTLITAPDLFLFNVSKADTDEPSQRQTELHHHLLFEKAHNMSITSKPQEQHVKEDSVNCTLDSLRSNIDQLFKLIDSLQKRETQSTTNQPHLNVQVISQPKISYASTEPSKYKRKFFAKPRTNNKDATVTNSEAIAIGVTTILKTTESPRTLKSTSSSTSSTTKLETNVPHTDPKDASSHNTGLDNKVTEDANNKFANNKGNFFSGLKAATLDLLHSVAKGLHMTTSVSVYPSIIYSVVTTSPVSINSQAESVEPTPSYVADPCTKSAANLKNVQLTVGEKEGKELVPMTNGYKRYSKESDDSKIILFSILKYESKKLSDELQRFWKRSGHNTSTSFR